MATNTVIYVPKGFRVQYTNSAGDEITEVLQSNREYQIDLKNGETVYATIWEVKNQKKNGGEDIIVPNLILTPGYKEAIRGVESEEDYINLSDVEKITMVHAKYVEDRRNYKQMKDFADEEKFTFAFDSRKYLSQYRITVFENEFVSLVVRNGDKKTTYYGCITLVHQDEIHFNHYILKNGVRVFSINESINAEDLLGIYRYTLVIEPWRDPKLAGRFSAVEDVLNTKETSEDEDNSDEETSDQTEDSTESESVCILTLEPESDD